MPAWLRQKSCLYSLGKSAFAQDSLLSGRNLLYKSPTHDNRNVPPLVSDMCPKPKATVTVTMLPEIFIEQVYDQGYVLVCYCIWWRIMVKKDTTSQFLSSLLTNSKPKDKKPTGYAKPAGSSGPRITMSGGLTEGLSEPMQPSCT